MTETLNVEPSVVDVVVVGAGIAGLAVAESLVNSGASVCVLEARSRTGGRIFSAPTSWGPVDLGATWFWDGEHRVEALMERLKLSTFSQHLAGDTIVEDARGRHRIQGNLIDVAAHRYEGGAGALTDALTARLPPGVVHLAHPVDRISPLEPSDTAAMDISSRGQHWRAWHVVLAVPPAVALDTIELPAQLPPALTRLAAATPVWMSQAAKVVALYNRPFWRHEGLAGAAMSRTGPLQEIHDMSGVDGQPAALFGFAPAALINATAERRIREQLQRMFGRQAAEPEHLIIQNWSTERWTTPAAQSGAAASTAYDLFGHPLYQQPALEGRLHWTSTETASSYAGHIEGALVAAERTAATITDALASTPHHRDHLRSDKGNDERKATL